MSVNHHNEPWKARLVRSLIALSLTLGAPLALALDTGDIVVTNTHGEVHFIVDGSESELQSGMVLELPATVRTGPDGTVGLMQGATTVNIGPDTVLEFPALEKRGGPIDRIIQPRGNAFYDVGKREGRKLRVETPYLVGVVKGTQFNVAAQGSASTISLFEGKLEIRAADDSDVVDITSGEVATRSPGDRGINVFRMDARPPSTQRPTNSPAGNQAPAVMAASRPATAPRNDASISGATAPGFVASAVGEETPADIAGSLTAVDAGGGASASVPAAVSAHTGGVEGVNSGSTGVGVVDVIATGNQGAIAASVAPPTTTLLDPGAGSSTPAAVGAGVASPGASGSVNVATPVVLAVVDAGTGSGSVSVGGVNISSGADLGLTAEDSQGTSGNSGSGNSGNSGNGNTNNGNGNGGASGNGNTNNGNGNGNNGNSGTGANGNPGSDGDNVRAPVDNLTHKPGKK